MECEDCGKCCMDVDAIMLLPSDYKKLKRVDKNIDNKLKYVSDIYYLMPDEHNVCIYFDRATKRCTIHENRPKVCKSYPFSFRSPQRDGKSSERLAQFGPETLYLTLCERFWTFTQEDYKESIKAIYKLRKEQFEMGILSTSQNPTEKEKKIRQFEETLTQEKKEKKFPFDLYLNLIQRNKVLFLLFLKLFDAYFDEPDDQKEEYETFIDAYVDKFETQPEMLQKAVEELKTRWKEQKKGHLNFSFSLN